MAAEEHEWGVERREVADAEAGGGMVEGRGCDKRGRRGQHDEVTRSRGRHWQVKGRRSVPGPTRTSRVSGYGEAATGSVCESGCCCLHVAAGALTLARAASAYRTSLGPARGTILSTLSACAVKASEIKQVQ